MLDLYRRLLDLLDARERRKFYLLMGLVMLMGAFDVVGVAIVLPFLAIVSDPSKIADNTILSAAYDFVNPASTEDFLILTGLLVFGVILVGTLIKIGTMYAISRFSLMRSYQISSRILEGYLRQPYAWFLNQNSARLSKVVLDETNQAMGSALIPAIRLFAQSVMLVLMVGLLLYVDPVAAIGAAAFIGLFYGVVYAAMRGLLRRMGQEMVAANRARFQTVSEALQGVKEVKLLGLETLYSGKFRTPARRQANALILTRFLSEFPRFALEAIAFGGIVLLVLLFLARGDGSIEEILPVLGVFVLGGLRILGAMQHIFNSLAALRSGRPVFDVVYADVMWLRDSPGLPPDAQGAQLGLSRALELRGVTYSYPKADRTALEKLDLTIPAKARIGIVGGTGAGKTTVVDLILGLLEPEAGQVLIDGTPLGRDTLRAWQGSIGYVPQQIYLTDDTVAANIAFGTPKEEIDMAAVIRAAKLAELHGFVTGQLEQGYDQMVGDRGMRLSGGQRQRIGIARALYHDPDVLILDEATSALDNLTEQAVMDAVANLGHAKTIIMIAHRLTTVQDCDSIVLMEHGRIVDQGPYTELVARNETFRRMAREK